MKQYNSLGELFVDYRKFNNLSQADFADKVNVDVRTVQRWERDVTLVKSEKEEEIVMGTLLPYQLIRNLNAAVAIPTYFDFSIRKYSLTELTNDLPEASWFKARIGISTNRLRNIDFNFDIKYITHFIESQKIEGSKVNKDLIKEAVRLLPELNLVLMDDSGYYAGHSIMMSIKEEAYLKIRNRELVKEQLALSDLVDYRKQKRAIFFNYDITADCNDNIFYLVCEFLSFFKDFNDKDYLFCSYTERYDSVKLSQDSGMKIVWVDEVKQLNSKIKMAPRFAEGNYKNFLKELK